MTSSDPRAVAGMLTALLQPWHDSVDDPSKAQQEVLGHLLESYAQTDYGAQHGATQIETVEDYRRAFPVATYEDYKPLIQQVMAGDVGRLLSEEPVGWAITRGTTKGESKFIPMTPTDLRMRISAGRAMMNYVVGSDRYDLFEGVNLNLNFPSAVGTIQVGEREIEYGYSSGIYVKYVSAFTPIRSLPAQPGIEAEGANLVQGAFPHQGGFSTPAVVAVVEKLHHIAISHPFKTPLPELSVGEQPRHMHQCQAVFDQHDQRRGHHVGEVGRFFQALRPGAPEGFQHRCCDVVWVLSLSRQDIEGDDIVCAGGVNVDQPVADIGVGKDTSGDKQPEQIIHQEGMGVDQAATASVSNILVEAIL